MIQNYTTINQIVVRERGRRISHEIISKSINNLLQVSVVCLYHTLRDRMHLSHELPPSGHSSFFLLCINQLFKVDQFLSSKSMFFLPLLKNGQGCYFVLEGSNMIMHIFCQLNQMNKCHWLLE